MTERNKRRKISKPNSGPSPPSKHKADTLCKSENDDKNTRIFELYHGLMEKMASPAKQTHAEILKDKRLFLLNDEDSFAGATGEVMFATKENDDKTNRHVAIKSTYITQPDESTDTCYRELLIHHTLNDLKHNNRCPNYIELIDWFKSKGWPSGWDKDGDDAFTSRYINHAEKTIREDHTSSLIFRVAPTMTGCGRAGLRKKQKMKVIIQKNRRYLGNRRYCSIEELEKENSDETEDDIFEPSIPPDDAFPVSDDYIVLSADDVTTVDMNGIYTYYGENLSDTQMSREDDNTVYKDDLMYLEFMHDVNDCHELDYDYTPKSNRRRIEMDNSSMSPKSSSQLSSPSSDEMPNVSSSQSDSHDYYRNGELRRKIKHVRHMKKQYMNFVLERADMTLNDHLKTMENKIDLMQYKCILFQILFSLHIAQRDFEFVHNDLHLGNVMMKHLSLPSYITHFAFAFEEKCWLCPVAQFPYMIKLTDFGLSRLKLPHNSQVLYNSRYPYHSSFLPFKDKVKIAQSLIARVKILWGQDSEEEKGYYRDFRKKMNREDQYTPTDLLCHPFFQTMVYDPDSITIDWEKHLEYTYGDVKIFKYLHLDRKFKCRSHHLHKTYQHNEEVPLVDSLQDLFALPDTSNQKRVQPKRLAKEKDEGQSQSLFTVIE